MVECVSILVCKVKCTMELYSLDFDLIVNLELPFCWIVKLSSFCRLPSVLEICYCFWLLSICLLFSSLRNPHVYEAELTSHFWWGNSTRWVLPQPPCRFQILLRSLWKERLHRIHLIFLLLAALSLGPPPLSSSWSITQSVLLIKLLFHTFLIFFSIRIWQIHLLPVIECE